MMMEEVAVKMSGKPPMEVTGQGANVAKRPEQMLETPDVHFHSRTLARLQDD